jgi:putative oxidoreductase
MKTLLSHVPTVARLLLGLVFTVFGLNFFLHFLPTPPMPGAAGAFAGALFASGYVFPVVKTVEVVAGLLLLSNRFVPLALALLAPVVVGIVGFHLALDPAGAGAALLALTLELVLAWSYRDAFVPMLQAHTAPRRAQAGQNDPRLSPAHAA